jgi:hypothetical protein
VAKASKIAIFMSENCIRCKKEFTHWSYNIDCTWGCDDGIYESDRDYGIVNIICPGCKGTGLQKHIEKDYCISCFQDLAEEEYE